MKAFEAGEEFERLVKAAFTRIAPAGFSRKGLTFRLLLGGNAGIIQFQKSAKSSRQEIPFTVNVGVVCGELHEPGDPPVNGTAMGNAHLRLRIGFLLPQKSDQWWTVQSGVDLPSLTHEVCEAVFLKAVPFIQNHLRTDDLIVLWKSGRSPGLTETQRCRYLAKLNARVIQ